MTMPRVKPILFNTEMIQANLDGRKNNTRRLMKGYALDHLQIDTDGSIIGVYDQYDGRVRPVTDYAPYQPGDILYVRETWQTVYETEWDRDAPDYCVNIRTRIPNFDSIPKVEAGISSESKCAAMKPRMKYFVFKASDIAFSSPENTLLWRPSIHMPKEAARLFLRVTDVRAERLQDIDSKGIRAEGLNTLAVHVGDMEISFREFARLWDSTIKKAELPEYGWNANPWVWVIQYEQCNKPEDS